jgi:hypothetical protein
LYSVDQMREYLTTQYGYSSDNIPISLGGTFDPILSGHIRYQICSSKVTNNQSICYPYYSRDYQPLTTKSTSNILFFHIKHDNLNKYFFSHRQVYLHHHQFLHMFHQNVIMIHYHHNFE